MLLDFSLKVTLSWKGTFRFLFAIISACWYYVAVCWACTSKNCSWCKGKGQRGRGEDFSNKKSSYTSGIIYFHDRVIDCFIFEASYHLNTFGRVGNDAQSTGEKLWNPRAQLVLISSKMSFFHKQVLCRSFLKFCSI